MIPILFESDETSFISNGLGRLADCIECKVTEELGTGVYECDFTYPITGVNFEEIQLGRIIAVMHDDTGDIQPFDIVSYSKPIDGVATFHAVHVSYRLTRYVVDPTLQAQVVDDTSEALTMFESAYPQDGVWNYETAYDTKAGYMAIANDGLPHSVRDMIGGSEGSFIDTYGGEIIWDKFTVRFTERRGGNVDFKIRYGVNMTSYKDEANGQETYTMAIPYWENSGEVVVGGVVDSGLPYYDRPLCVPMNLSDAFEFKPTTAQLETMALEIMQGDPPNVPKRSIEVEFIRLQDLEEYPAYVGLLDCELGDSVEVIYPGYDVSSTFRVVKVIWDVLRDRFDTMTLGSLQTTLAEALGVGGGGMTNVGGGGGGGSVVSFQQILSSGERIGVITIDGTPTDIYAPSGGGGGVFFGTCGTAAATAAKVVTCPSFTAADLTAGTVLYVDFTYSNTVASPTLNVNSTGAKDIMRYGTTRPSTSAASSWNAGSIVCMVYDGTYWNIEGWLNTTYSAISQANIENQSGTSTGLITGQRFTQGLAARLAISQTLASGTEIAEITLNGTATKLYAPSSGLQNTFYGTSSTAAATANKDVVCSDWLDNYGDIIAVTFTNANTAQSPQLAVNGGTARPIFLNGSTSGATWEAGETVTFMRRQYGGGTPCFEYLSNGNAYALADGKSTVTWNQVVTTGTKIAEITINGGSPTDVYAPTGGGGSSYTATAPISISAQNDISHNDSGVGSAGYTTAYYDSKNGYYIPRVEYDSKGHLTDITNTLGTLIPLNTGTSGSTNPVVLSQYSWALAQRSYSNTGFTLFAGSTTQSQTISADANSSYSYQSNFRVADVQAYDATTFEPVVVDWSCDKVFSAGGSITVTISIAQAYSHDIRWFPVFTYATASM